MLVRLFYAVIRQSVSQSTNRICRITYRRSLWRSHKACNDSQGNLALAQPSPSRVTTQGHTTALPSPIRGGLLRVLVQRLWILGQGSVMSIINASASLLFLVLILIPCIGAEFCSNTNTGASFQSVYSIYQSVGACAGTCSGYAFAILQDHFCWCSNYSPQVAVSSNLCNESCPGFPSDQCGNEASGLFSYVQIGQGSGILSSIGSQATSGNSEGDNSPTAVSPNSIATVTVDRGTTLIITSFIPTEPSLTLGSLSTFSSSPGHSGTAANQPENSQPSGIQVAQSSSFWDSTGKVAGVFVAVGVVIALLAMALVWVCWNRRVRADEEKRQVVSQPMARQPSGAQSVSRSASLLQLLGRRDRDRQEDASSPVSSPVPPSNHRLSRTPTELVVPVVDQRLDPQSMMIRFDENDSRTSFRDDEDYSRRVWRVTNVSDSDSLRSA